METARLLKPVDGAVDEAQAQRIQELFAALGVDPNQTELLLEVGALTYEAGEFKPACFALERLHGLVPGTVASWGMLASIYYAEGRLEESISAGCEALQRNPRYGDLWLYLGIASAGRGDFGTAIDALTNAATLLPDEGGVADRLWRTKLLAGQWAEGWRDSLDLVPPAIDGLWQGSHGTRHRFWRSEPLRDKEIVVFNHGGYGDVINFLRFVDGLAEERPSAIILIVPPALLRLVGAAMRDHPAALIIRVQDPDLPLQDHPGYFTWFENLAAQYGAEPGNVQGERIYLHADAVAVSRWRRQLAKGSDHDGPRKIGIIWRGRPTTNDDRWRSIPLKDWTAFLATPGCRFYALQNGPLEEAETQLLEAAGAIDLSDQISDFADLAVIMSALDGIVSVDTGAVHLAGALGCKTILLNRANSEWRWGWKPDRSFWYPHVSIVNQDRLNDWHDALLQAALQLQAL